MKWGCRSRQVGLSLRVKSGFHYSFHEIQPESPFPA